MIRVDGLWAGYYTGFRRRWRDVLQGVSFHVPRGSVTGYLGVNGAGKTTTIKVLVGINRPSRGTVRIGDAEVGTRAAQLQVGYFPEAPFFYDGLTARELLDFFGRVAGVAAEARRQRAGRLLEEVGLGAAADLQVKGFSKGMRQRLGLAQALVHDPELLVLDEPLDGLDPMGRLHLRELIAAQAAKGRTIFFSSHVLSDVETVCNHLVVLDGGSVAFDGETREFCDDGGERVQVVFRLGADGDRAAAAAAAGVEPSEAEGGLLKADCPGRSEADALIAAVVRGDGRIVSVEHRRPSLEATFMARFGGGAGAKAGTA